MPELKIAPLSQECSKDHYTAEGGSFTGIGTAISQRPKCKYSTKEAYIRTSTEFQEFQDVKTSYRPSRKLRANE